MHNPMQPDISFNDAQCRIGEDILSQARFINPIT